MKNSLFCGTIILISANIISKILGAILKIPLTYILGEDGMAIYHTTFSIYITVLFLVTSGIPFAVSKYISQELALSNKNNIKSAVRISLIIMTFLGLIGSLVLFFGAEFYAYALKEPKAVLTTKILAPSVLFVAIGTVYKALFEAYTNMIPTAVSQVIESIVKLVLGYLFASWLISFSVTYAACGALFSITAGELIATIILGAMYLPYKNELKNTISTTKGKEITSRIISVAIPMMITSVISSNISLLETSIIRNRLLDITFSEKSSQLFLNSYSRFTDVFDNITQTLKLDIDGARWLFGAYSGYAATVFNLPLGVLSSISVSIVPVITRYSVLKQSDKLNEIINAVLKVIIILSIPCCIIFTAYPKEILYILFKNMASAKMLMLMSPIIVTASLSNLLSAALYASGHIYTPFYNETISTVLKIIVSYLIIKIPEVNILGVIIASFLGNLLLLILNIRSVNYHLKINLTIIRLFTRNILPATGMAILCFILKTNLNTSGNAILFIISASISIIVYFILIYLTGTISKKEISLLKS